MLLHEAPQSLRINSDAALYHLTALCFPLPRDREFSTMAKERIVQIARHLNYPKGMLAGQVAIITGSGQGIGAEAARLFANEGAKVVVQDIDAGVCEPSS